MSDCPTPPAEIVAAAEKVGTWFAEQGVSDWALGPCRSRWPTPARYKAGSAYTAEQKAAAFDALWDMGNAFGTRVGEVHRRKGDKVVILPRFEFVLRVDGDLPDFYDVLDHLATKSA